MIVHSEERRRDPRIPVLVRVECETPQNCIFGNCENLCETGMWIAARQIFDVSQKVILRMVPLTIELGIGQHRSDGDHLVRCSHQGGQVGTIVPGTGASRFPHPLGGGHLILF